MPIFKDPADSLPRFEGRSTLIQRLKRPLFLAGGCAIAALIVGEFIAARLP